MHPVGSNEEPRSWLTEQQRRALLRRELDGMLEDARAAARDGSRSAAERRRELYGDLAEARLGSR